MGGRRHGLRLAAVTVVSFLGVHLVLPQLGGLERTGEQLARATWWLPAGVVLLEAASFAGYGELIGVVLRAGGGHAPRGLLQRVTVVSSSLGKTLPGGSATGLALTVRTLAAHGVDAAGATAALAASGLLSPATLALLLPIGALLAVASGHTGGIALGGLAAAAVTLLAVAAVPVLAHRPEQLGMWAGRAAATLARGPLRRRPDPAASEAAVRHGATTVARLTRDRRTLAVAVGWALVNWLADVAVLVLVAVTLGAGTPLTALLLAYVIAQLVAAVPLTPGGVGVVETAMTGALVAGGAPAAAATTTVLGWRLISHWLPIVAGLVLLPSVTRRTGRVR